MVFTIIHPLGNLRLAFASELMSVEITNEILGSRTAEWSTWVDVADKHPLLLVSATNLHLHQVWALPDSTMISVCLTKRAFEFPILQVIRSIDFHVLTSSQNHIPLLDVFIPEHVRITEVRHIAGDNRVALIFGKSLAIVGTVNHTLSLAFTSRSIKCDDSTLAEAGSILLINHSRSTEDCTQSICLNRITLELPVHQVGGSRMSPGHILPLRSVWIVLEIEIPYTIFIEHTVRVVHPTVGRSMMIDWAILLSILHIEGIGETHILPT